MRVPVPKWYILWPHSTPYIGTLGKTANTIQAHGPLGSELRFLVDKDQPQTSLRFIVNPLKVGNRSKAK